MLLDTADESADRHLHRPGGETVPDSALPKITVITPSFNQAKYLQATIDSVLSQNYPNLEWLVVDGGSKDGSVDLIKKYEQHFTWWVSEKDRCHPHALNKGFERATGEITCFVNSDDLAGTRRAAVRGQGVPEAERELGRRLGEVLRQRRR